MEKLMTPKKFSMQVETIVQECGCSHMEAVLDYCAKNQIEPDTIKPPHPGTLTHLQASNLLLLQPKDKLFKILRHADALDAGVL